MINELNRTSNHRPKLLILYAKFGDGHYQAAQALKQSFGRLGVTDVRLVDLLAESHPMINEVSRFVYIKSYTYWPQVYGWVYEATKGMKPSSLFAHWLHSFGADTLRRLIRNEEPDAVIHTFPSLVLPAITGRLGRHIPMYNVVTDFDLHMRWVHPEVNKYYVATEDLGKELTRAGVPPEKITATGIPLRSSFETDRCSVTYAAIRYGLDPNRPVVLVMAGAYGVLSGVRELCRRLTKNRQAQVALVCGRNRALADNMRAEFAANDDVVVFGYLEQIHELMSLSACIITKPGGLTLSEAILAGLPIFLYRPVPGQERGNARYLAAKGAAVICRTPGELAGAVAGLLQSPAKQSEMQDAIAGLRKEGASDRIALDILEDLPIIKLNEFVGHP